MLPLDAFAANAVMRGGSALAPADASAVGRTGAAENYALRGGKDPLRAAF
jgi:hypothetical protein